MRDPPADRYTPKISCLEPLTFIGRQNRAPVVASWLLAVGPIQKSQTKPTALPDPRTTSRLARGSPRARRFSFES